MSAFPNPAVSEVDSGMKPTSEKNPLQENAKRIAQELQGIDRDISIPLREKVSKTIKVLIDHVTNIRGGLVELQKSTLIGTPDYTNESGRFIPRKKGLADLGRPDILLEEIQHLSPWELRNFFDPELGCGIFCLDVCIEYGLTSEVIQILRKYFQALKKGGERKVLQILTENENIFYLLSAKNSQETAEFMYELRALFFRQQSLNYQEIFNCFSIVPKNLFILL